ncbi:hypothetical protein GWO13_10655 [Candidatus Bathyarchaeota archaeon]|nr:hypothetical protein [Candidatus Bathyarchaeota archaeon]
MEIKEMPLEEKYEKLLDQWMLDDAKNFAFHKELGVLDKYEDFDRKVAKKMIPSMLGVGFKVFKAITPSRAFKQLVKQLAYVVQLNMPLANMEVTMDSDREATMIVNNCPKLLRTRELVKKAGLNINPVAMCAREGKHYREFGEWFGVEIKVQFKKDGCIGKIKLK